MGNVISYFIYTVFILYIVFITVYTVVMYSIHSLSMCFTTPEVLLMKSVNQAAPLNTAATIS